MNRFFRSALFPLIIIAALVWLALQTLGNRNAKVVKETTSQVYNLVSTPGGPGQIDGPVKINPSKQELALTLTDGKKIVVHYATAQSEAALEQAMLKHNVPFDSKGVGSSPWWSILTSLLPFVLLIGFWIFLMNQMQGGGSKVMSFGKSRAKRMTPDAPKTSFKDVA
ncbi:MAG TPA: hypothetical protein VIL98_06690, partial [Gaiellaceae bacterium]